MNEGEKRLDTVRLQELVQGFWRSGARGVGGARAVLRQRVPARQDAARHAHDARECARAGPVRRGAAAAAARREQQVPREDGRADEPELPEPQDLLRACSLLSRKHI